jgi:predicted nucleic acid-binding protein
LVAGRGIVWGATSSYERLFARHAQRRRTPLPVIDGLLAATALHHHLTMVTRNVHDFQGHNIQSFNPWEKL